MTATAAMLLNGSTPFPPIRAVGAYGFPPLDLLGEYDPELAGQLRDAQGSARAAQVAAAVFEDAQPGGPEWKRAYAATAALAAGGRGERAGELEQVDPGGPLLQHLAQLPHLYVAAVIAAERARAVLAAAYTAAREATVTRNRLAAAMDELDRDAVAAYGAVTGPASAQWAAGEALLESWQVIYGLYGWLSAPGGRPYEPARRKGPQDALLARHEAVQLREPNTWHDVPHEVSYGP